MHDKSIKPFVSQKWTIFENVWTYLLFVMHNQHLINRGGTALLNLVGSVVDKQTQRGCLQSGFRSK